MSLNISDLLDLLNSSVVDLRSTGVVGYSWPNLLAMSFGIVGITSNLINILVFVNPLLKDVTFRYLLAKSIIVLFYYACAILNVFLVYCVLCPVTFTYAANLYSIAIGFYVSNSLNIMRIFIEITISLRTYAILNNRTYCIRISYLFIIGLIVLLGLAYYSVRLAAFRIVSLPRFGIYYVAYTDFALSGAYQVITIAQEMIRVILIVVVLTLINVLSLIKFRRRFKQRQIGVLVGQVKLVNQTSTANSNVSGVKKSQVANKPASQTQSLKTLTSEQSAERNNEATRSITKMILVTSFIRILCEIPFLFAFMLLATGNSTVAVNSFFYAAASLIYVPPFCDLFVYYFFNKNFKSVLNGYFRLVFVNRAQEKF